MDMSVIICTHNRQALLRKCLAKTLAQSVEQIKWEIIVIANACTDETATMVNALVREQPALLRLVEEPKVGLSVARNTGAKASKARWLIYIDDDAWPEPGWLAAYANFIQKFDKVPAGGGPIQLDWNQTPQPSYWRSEFDVFLGQLRLDPPEAFFPFHRFPFGGNMFFEKNVFWALGGFNPQFGARGSTIGYGEETDLFRRLVAQGAELGYARHALVSHRVNPGKITRQYLWRQNWQLGLTETRSNGRCVHPHGLVRWLRHFTSALVRGRLDLAQQLYLLRWLGQLWEGQKMRCREAPVGQGA